MARLATFLTSKGAAVEYLWLSDTDEKTGLDDYLMAHSGDELWTLVHSEMPPESGEPHKEPPTTTTAGSAAHTAAEPIPRERAHEIFKKWLGDEYDTDALDAELATLAVEKFDDGSDPSGCC